MDRPLWVFRKAQCGMDRKNKKRTRGTGPAGLGIFSDRDMRFDHKCRYLLLLSKKRSRGFLKFAVLCLRVLFFTSPESFLFCLCGRLLGPSSSEIWMWTGNVG